MTNTDREAIEAALARARKQQTDDFMRKLEAEADDLCYCEERRQCSAHELVSRMTVELYGKEYAASRPWARRKES